MKKEVEEKVLSLGAIDYITKPFSMAIINAKLRNHLKIKIRHDELTKIALHDQLTGLNNPALFS
ncbi:MAG: hypothetical protein R3E95_02985 [Thiolinea sp.]